MGIFRRLWPRRYRYEAIIVGLESGNETRLPFVRFRHRAVGLTWCARMNLTPGYPETRFELRPIGLSEPDVH